MASDVLTPEYYQCYLKITISKAINKVIHVNYSYKSLLTIFWFCFI